MPNSATLKLALPALLMGFVLTGCQAERPIVAPVDPDWSYHDGADQLSNNDTWKR